MLKIDLISGSKKEHNLDLGILLLIKNYYRNFLKWEIFSTLVIQPVLWWETTWCVEVNYVAIN